MSTATPEGDQTDVTSAVVGNKTNHLEVPGKEKRSHSVGARPPSPTPSTASDTAKSNPSKRRNSDVEPRKTKIRGKLYDLVDASGGLVKYIHCTSLLTIATLHKTRSIEIGRAKRSK